NQSTAVPGTSLTYTITVSNAGPSDALGVRVDDLLPFGFTDVTWLGSNGHNGSGDLHDTIDLPAGGLITYTLTGTIAPSLIGLLSNTVTVTPSTGTTDPDPANNSATDTDSLLPVADLSVSKTDNQSTAVPGTSLTYTITVSNAGPSDALGVRVDDLLPFGFTDVTWRGSNGHSGSGDLHDTIDLPAGGLITYTLTGLIAPSLIGLLSNTVTVTPSTGTTDPDPANNSATDTDSLLPVADLSVSKTDNQSTAVPGTSLTYTITVSNAGPSDALGVRVDDLLPFGFTDVTWLGSNGHSGSGDLHDTIDLPAGGLITYTLTGLIAPSLIGLLSNTVTVTPSTGTTDPDSANNSATDTDSLLPVADLSVSKTDNQSTAVPGTSLTYTITVSNAGPSDALGVRVDDLLPFGFTDVTWLGSNGHSGSGDLHDTIDLPAGGLITYTLTGLIAPSLIGLLSNTVTVTPSTGTTDPDPANNSATDTDSLLPVADLSVSKTDNQSTAVPGTSLTYTITVSNAGPSDALGVRVDD